MNTNQNHPAPGKPIVREDASLYVKVPVIVDGERVAAFKTVEQARKYAAYKGGKVGTSIHTDFAEKLASAIGGVK